jgi:hypothetical protein
VNQGQMQQQYGAEMRGMAGNILGSGVYGGTTQATPQRTGGGFMGIPGIR